MNEEPKPLPPPKIQIECPNCGRLLENCVGNCVYDKPRNDVHSRDFESHLDPFFSSKGKEAKGTNFTRWGKDDARSALATTRPQ